MKSLRAIPLVVFLSLLMIQSFLNVEATLDPRHLQEKIKSSVWEALSYGDDLMNKLGVKDQISEAVEFVGYHTGLGEQCKFVDHPSESVRNHLQKHLRSQDRAIEAVVSAIESWEFSRTPAKARTPLIIAITGPTGTGKTETSNLIAEALFKRKRTIENSDKQVPGGLLIFRGEDFSDTVAKPITEYHEQIKQRLYRHLTTCSGKAVVVFDEVQKVIPHTLDVIMQAVSSQSKLTVYKNGVSHTLDCSNVIFILVSDIGADQMFRLILAHDSRDNVPQSELVSSVKDALDEQWKRLQFGKMINEVIPFLPFEEHHIADIISLKLNQMDISYRKKYWKTLRFDSQLPQYLAKTKHVKYVSYKTQVHGQERKKVYAKYGARNVENSGPIQRLKSKLFRYLQPWNPHADITISLILNEKEKNDEMDISIDSCFTILQPQEHFDNLTCVTKWKGIL